MRSSSCYAGPAAIVGLQSSASGGTPEQVDIHFTWPHPVFQQLVTTASAAGAVARPSASCASHQGLGVAGIKESYGDAIVGCRRRCTGQLELEQLWCRLISIDQHQEPTRSATRRRRIEQRHRPTSTSSRRGVRPCSSAEAREPTGIDQRKRVHCGPKGRCNSWVEDGDLGGVNF